MNFHGYEIEKHPAGGYVIRLGGEVVCSQPSLEFAKGWVSRNIRESKLGKLEEDTPPHG